MTTEGSRETASSRLPARVTREYALAQLSQMVEEDSPAVVVSGEPGSGKTHLLRDLVESIPTRGAMVEISTASRWAYDPELVLHQLQEALSGVAGGALSPAPGAQSESDLRRVLIAVGRAARRAGAPVVLAIDGLENIDDTDAASRDLLLQQLPFGAPGLRIVLSDGPQAESRLGTLPRGTRHFALGPFLAHETELLLSDLGLDSESLRTIHRIARGNPGRLASVWRILTMDPSLREEVSNLPTNRAAMFQLEWDTSRLSEPSDQLALAMLSASTVPLSTHSIAQLVARPETEIEVLLARLLFVKGNGQVGWTLLSDSHRALVSARVGKSTMARAYEAILRSQLEQPESEESLTDLPLYFQRAGRLKELLEYLSPQRTATLFRSARSITSVRRATAIALSSADELERHDELARFAMHSSTLEQLSEASSAAAEVRARVAVGDTAGAERLARAGAAVESRARLLVAYARARLDRGLGVPAELTDEIERLLLELDAHSLGDADIEFAAELFPISQAAAMRFLNLAAESDPDSGRRDWGLASIAMAAAPRDEPASRAQAMRLADEIKDPRVRRVVAASTILMSSRSAVEAIRAAKSLEKADERAFLLRSWMLANREQPDAVDVLEYALQSAMAPTGSQLPATFFREIAVCLPHVVDVHRRSYYVSVLDRQAAVLASIGPSHEVMRLRMILARAEAKSDLAAALARLEDVYLELSQTADALERASGLARLANVAAALVEANLQSVALLDLEQAVEGDLERAIDNILRRTAEHTDALQEVLRARVAGVPAKARELAARLNTPERRDAARLLLIRELGQLPLSALRIEAMRNLYDDCTDRRAACDAVEDALRQVGRRRLSPAAEGLFPQLGEVALALESSDARARALATLIGLHARTSAAAIPTHWLVALVNSWEVREQDWRKLDLGFYILAVAGEYVVTHRPEFAQEVFAVRGQLALADEDAVGTTALGVQLVIRGYGALCELGLASPEHSARVLSLVNQVDVVDERVALLSELIARMWLGGERETAADMTASELIPMLDDRYYHNRPEWPRAFILSAAALFAASPNWAFLKLRDLSAGDADEALEEALRLVVGMVPPGEPCEDGVSWRADRSIDGVSLALRLLREMRADSALFWGLSLLVEALDPRARRSQLSRQQLAEVRRELEQMVDEKLPTPGYLRHDGYHLVAHAQLRRLVPDRNAAPDVSDLKARVPRVDNASDQVYVYAVLSEVARGQAREELCQLACDTADSIPVLEERLSRLLMVAESIGPDDASIGKRVLGRAMAAFKAAAESAHLGSVRRQMVDLAHRLDPAFAQRLVEQFDDDPARQHRRLAERRLQAKEYVAEGAGAAQVDRSLRELIPGAAWRRLGAQNAGRREPLEVGAALRLMRDAARMPMRESYPLLALALESLLSRDARAGNPRGLVLPLFEATLRGAEMNALAVGRARVGLESPRRVAGESASRVEVIGMGEEPKALTLLNAVVCAASASTLVVVDAHADAKTLASLRTVVRNSTVERVVLLTGRLRLSGDSALGVSDLWQSEADVEPPILEVIECYFRGAEKAPFHDRFLAAGVDSGVMLGTSLNGLGLRVSTISSLRPSEVQRLLDEHQPFLDRSRHIMDGKRVLYRTSTA